MMGESVRPDGEVKMADNNQITIHFGGDCRELWTDDGLTVSYSGGAVVLALRRDGGWLALAPPCRRGGNVKADYLAASAERELCERLNARSAPPLTTAYFLAAADAAEALQACGGDFAKLPQLLSAELSGGMDALLPIELLRLLLDEYSLTWDDAAAHISRCCSYRAATNKTGATVPLGALAALQPRDARLVSAVNEKLCEKLRKAFPGDWDRVGACAVLRDGELRLDILCAALCGKTYSTKEQRAGVFRTLFTLTPARFEDI